MEAGLFESCQAEADTRKPRWINVSYGLPYNHRNIRKPAKKATVKLFGEKKKKIRVEVTNWVTEHKQEPRQLHAAWFGSGDTAG